ncbi:hypothetical protein [Paludibaculum fermentans]|uniref:UspA domain-containing protein n=1 Tax=Paludibaculum fermentans TaxID=1473598 RepID=A0A7S7NPJ5_PALFE|nr:hypothetical protein [Paludibaculum fermentans]QOY86924.1 hypothetical protein IRI77_29740 [Paludibaculum fermentans]
MTTQRAFQREDTGQARAIETGRDGSAPHCFEIVVLFTTVRETLGALRTAGRLAQGVATSIRLLVPQVVPYPLPLDEPPVSSGHLIREFQVVLEDSQLETRIDVRRCRDHWQAVGAALKPRSVVVMGGSRGWWPSRKYRLAARLRSAGHQVVFSSPE